MVVLSWNIGPEEMSEDYADLVIRNEQLEELILKLRDVSITEKQEKDKRIKELERDNKNLPLLQGN